MPALRRLLGLGALLAVLGTAGCSDPRSRSRRTLREVGAPALRAEAAAFYKELFATPNRRTPLPKIRSCPPSFQRFQPVRVRVYPDGFALALREASSGEEGLYVVPRGMEQSPREGRSARFEKIDDGIFWYVFASE